MAPRIVIIGLASDFGCQVQVTNMEDHLLEVLGTIELGYWQLASSGHLPEAYDVAVIEGAVTTVDHVELLKQVRATAASVIAMGACAVTGGIPGLAAGPALEGRVTSVYGDGDRLVAKGRIQPLAVGDVIDVDYRIPGCPIQPAEFVRTLQRALMGLADRPPREPMCAACKMAENECFYDRGAVCLGVVTRTGCGAKCISLGRACTGCRGVAEDANLDAARLLVARAGVTPDRFGSALELYNSLSEVAR
jgi:coenzyme F420-reducing hydrogenase gamma subunit